MKEVDLDMHFGHDTFAFKFLFNSNMFIRNGKNKMV